MTHAVVSPPSLMIRAREAAKEVYYGLRRTPHGRAVVKALAFLRSPRETRRRRRAAAALTHHGVRVQIDRARGFAPVGPGDFEGFDRVRAICLELFETKRAKIEREVAEMATGTAEEQERYRAAKRKFLRNLFSNDDLRRNPELVDFALSDALLGAATAYLGTIPNLNRVDLLYSVPRDSEDQIASQLFHVDPEGLTQVKFFINVFPVGDPEGPFTFIPADDTERILAAVRTLRRRRRVPHSGRYFDEEIAAVGGSDAIIRASGPIGSGVAIDTSRCLHMGSRVAPGAFRLCLYLQYCTSREHGNAFELKRFKKDPVRRLALINSTRSEGRQVKAPHDGGG